MACKRSAVRSRLGLVVDDADMGVTHVIRGDDHLNNTPRQMNMLLALNKPSRRRSIGRDRVAAH